MIEVKDRPDDAGAEPIDPIDQLVPLPRPLVVRLVIGVAVIGVVGTLSVLIGFGYVYPQPDCCGSASGSAQMALTSDGAAVQVSMLVGNSSGRTLRIDGGEADLPGAEVLSVGAIEWGEARGFRVPFEPQRFPVEIRERDDALVIVTFRPTECVGPDESTGIDPSAWGELTLDLEVVDNGVLPSIGRSYRVPGHVVEGGSRQVSIFPTGDEPIPQTPDPIAAACELLGLRTPSPAVG